MKVKTEGFYASEPMFIEDDGHKWTANAGLWFTGGGKIYKAGARDRRVEVDDFTDQAYFGEYHFDNDKLQCVFMKNTLYRTVSIYDVISSELLIHVKSGRRFHFIPLSESELKQALEIFDQKAKKS